MRPPTRALPVLATLLAALTLACSTQREAEEHGSAASTEARGEHDRDGEGHGREEGGEHGVGGGEESGTELALDASFDEVRNGARLILAYDAASLTFRGTVENTTKETLERVRVEVHLSNGKELGPTTPVTLTPGAKLDVSLSAMSTDFEHWSAHAEVGSGEHGGEHGG